MNFSSVIKKLFILADKLIIMNYKRAAGILIFTGAVQFIIGMNVAEFLYPGYSVSNNFISDLGATCRGSTCTVNQPSATIFNLSVSLLGLFILIGSYFLWREFQSPVVPILFALTGIGAIGVGMFPETSGMIHEFVSLIAFLFGGLSAISSIKIAKAPISYFSVLMGITSLIALVLFAFEIYLGFGPGGMERMIAYPMLLWAAGFGGYLMSS